MMGTVDNSVVQPTHTSMERSRLRLQRELNIFSSPKDEAVQRIVLMTSRVFKMPMVGLTFLDFSRHLFKYSCGLDLVEVPRSLCFSSYEHDTSPISIIHDTMKSLTDHPFIVDAPYVRFYCGAGIFVDGVKIGVLCILDSQPHPEFGPAQQATLIDIANVTSDLINHKRLLQPARSSIVEEITLQHDIFTAVQSPLQHVNSVMSQMKHIIKPNVLGTDIKRAGPLSTSISPCPSSDSDSKFCRSSDEDADDSHTVSVATPSLLPISRDTNNHTTDINTIDANKEVMFNSEAVQFNPSLEQLAESLKSEVCVLEHTLDRSIQKLLRSQQQHL